MAFIPGPGERPKMQSVAWEDSSPMGRQPHSQVLNTGFSGSQVEDGHNKVKEMKAGRRNGKPRRKFTKDELHVLNYTFEENPYPDFTIRKTLAEQLYCQIYVIDNWFQNKRARLPLKERQRIFAARKLRLFPVQSHSRLSVQDPQAESPRATEKTCFSTQEALPEGAGYFFPGTQRAPSQQVGSGDAVVPGIAKEQSYDLEYQGDTGSRLYPNYPFYSYDSAVSFHPSTFSGQYLENYGAGTGESWESKAHILHHVCGTQGERQQQQQACCPYSLCQGQQHNGY
ncbi:cytoplasmic polyadenylated homeobox-like protein 2 [Acinonyx jubatus]|uniref:Cytoplasmic polyadenylated homeobox-like protein 2 n=1 Tax=Acinonyx jubatus TaxID=32536 RepID=A0ABM3NUQ7_ACIJB|nr:cytoplasmic polyadenylated homeobox-like protein 2 [Acinonyx jubatus]